MQAMPYISAADPEIEAREAEQRAQRDRVQQKLRARGVEQPAAPTPTPAAIENLDARLTEAEAELGKLKQAAEKAKAAAKDAETAFTRDPTPKSHTDAAVARQKSINAMMAVESFTASGLYSLRVEKQRQLDLAELAELREALHWDHVQKRLDRIQTAVETLASEIDGAVPEIAKLLELRREKAPRAISLGLPVSAVSFDGLVSEISAKLTAKLSIGTSVTVHKTHVQLALVDTASDVPALRVTMNRPAKIPSHVR